MMLQRAYEDWFKRYGSHDKRLKPLRRLLLRIALGHTYWYMLQTLAADPRLKTCRMADVVVRKDAVERRFEADWLKTLCRITERDFRADGQWPERDSYPLWRRIWWLRMKPYRWWQKRFGVNPAPQPCDSAKESAP